MFEFEDELIIIDSYRIPWLIWIQLLAMFLLVIIIYYFTTESDDDHNQFSLVTASPSVGGVSFASPSIISSGGDAKESEIIETGTSTGEVVQRARKSNAQQSEGPSTMDYGNMIFENSHHPCNFLGLAKKAFLKCLGIDSTPESSTRKHEKSD